MKKLVLLCCSMVIFSISMMASTNGDPVTKVISEIEKASITLTDTQKADIQALFQSTFRDGQQKTTGEKGSRKGALKAEKKQFKRGIYNNILTADQRQKFDVYKGR